MNYNIQAAMRQTGILSILFSGVIALLICHAAGAREIPRLKGRVNDYAGILSPSTQRHLDLVLKDLEQSDSTQIAVLTLPSLEDENLEAFSIRLAEQWKIGQKGLDNGAILLIALKERKVRIEVGYGLEGRLTDLVAGRIIRNVIVPRFKSGDFDQGVIDGVAAIIGTVKGEYTPPQRSRRPGTDGGRLHQIIFALIAFAFLINLLGRLRRGLGLAAGGVVAPIIAGMFFDISLVWLLMLIPLGVLAGLVLSLIGSTLSFGNRNHGIGYWGGRFGPGGGGGFTSGGFGGFSGGGGGFGGGGASGGW
jgi:uncharacterized protein